MSGARSPSFDLLLVGGGLANALLAYRLRALRPELDVLVLEAGASFGGNHTWSFHESDLTPDQRAWTAPVVAHRWPSYDVIFPGLRREVKLAYCSATSDQLDRVLRAADVPVRFGAAATRLSPTEVVLESGETLRARAVIDGRGAGATPHMRFGWQKFVGHEVRTARPHGLQRPILMDATVPQHDGYRFVYLLPFAADRLLIEDTYYSDGSALDRPALTHRIAEIAASRGWPGVELLRAEEGILPITLAGDIRGFWDAKAGQPCAGLRAGLFHPTTGFSWPDAVRFADHIAQSGDLAAGPLFATIRRYADEKWRRQRFFRALDRMLFLAGPPAERWRMMEHFYRLDEPAIARFYAGRLRLADRVRLLVGRPPVSVRGAVAALRDTTVGGRRG